MFLVCFLWPLNVVQRHAVRSQAQSIEERIKEGIQVENKLKAQVSLMSFLQLAKMSVDHPSSVSSVVSWAHAAVSFQAVCTTGSLYAHGSKSHFSVKYPLI